LHSSPLIASHFAFLGDAFDAAQQRQSATGNDASATAALVALIASSRLPSWIHFGFGGADPDYRHARKAWQRSCSFSRS